MAHNSTQFITHTFGGGWATDFGPTFYGGPEGTSMRLPWLNDAKNCVFEFDGGPRKAPSPLILLDFGPRHHARSRGPTPMRRLAESSGTFREFE